MSNKEEQSDEPFHQIIGSEAGETGGENKNLGMKKAEGLQIKLKKYVFLQKVFYWSVTQWSGDNHREKSFFENE